MAIKKSTLAGVCAACAAVAIVGGGYAVSVSGYPTLLKNTRAVVQEQMNATLVDLIGNPAKISVDFSEPRSALFNHDVTMVIVNEDNSDIVRLPMTIDTKFLGYDFTFDLAHATVNDENALKYLDFSGITALESTGSYHILADEFKLKVDASYLTNAEAVVNIAAHLKALNSYFEQQQAQKALAEAQAAAPAAEPATEPATETAIAETAIAEAVVAQNVEPAAEAKAAEPATEAVAEVPAAEPSAPVADAAEAATVETAEIVVAQNAEPAAEAQAAEPATENPATEPTAPAVASQDVAVAQAAEPAKGEAEPEAEAEPRDEVNELFAQYVEQFKKDIGLKNVGTVSFELSANGDEKVMISIEADSLAQQNVIWQNLSLFTQFYGLSNLKSLEQFDIAADGLAVINNDGYNLVKNAVFHLSNARRGVASKNFPFTLDVGQCDKLVDYHSSGLLQNLNIAMLDDQELSLSFSQYLEQYPITISINQGSSLGLNTFVKKDEISEAVPTTIPVHFSGALGSYIAETPIETSGIDDSKVQKHPVFYSDFVFNADGDFSKIADDAVEDFKAFFETSGNKSSAQIRYEFDGYDEKLVVNGKEQ